MQTFDGQWSFTSENVILKAAAVDAVIEVGEKTIFTFEFYPRVEGNTVEYTLSP